MKGIRQLESPAGAGCCDRTIANAVVALDAVVDGGAHERRDLAQLIERVALPTKLATAGLACEVEACLRVEDTARRKRPCAVPERLVSEAVSAMTQHCSPSLSLSLYAPCRTCLADRGCKAAPGCPSSRRYPAGLRIARQQPGRPGPPHTPREWGGAAASTHARWLKPAARMMS